MTSDNKSSIDEVNDTYRFFFSFCTRIYEFIYLFLFIYFKNKFTILKKKVHYDTIAIQYKGKHC